MTKYLSTAEVAKIIRKELKENFPGIKFSVRSKVYAGGSSIRIGYTDGPAYNKVNSLVQKFAGATFDGMIDMKEYKDDIEYNGEIVSLGVDYIFTDRHHSNETFKAICLAVAEKYGADTPVFGGGTENECIYVKENEQNKNYVHNSLHTEFHREFSKWDEQDGPVNGSDDLPGIKEYERDMADYQVNRYSNEPVDCLTDYQEDVFEQAAEMLPLYSFDEKVKNSKVESWKVW